MEINQLQNIVIIQDIFGPSMELLKTYYLKTAILFFGSLMLLRIIGAIAGIIFV